MDSPAVTQSSGGGPLVSAKPPSTPEVGAEAIIKPILKAITASKVELMVRIDQLARRSGDMKNPLSKCYSHLSRTHTSSARIDLAFANLAFLTMVWDVSYLAEGVSDHTLLSVDLAVPSEAGRGTWQMATGRTGLHTIEGGYFCLLAC